MSGNKKSRFSGFLGIDPTLGLGDKVIDHIEEAQEEEKERLQKSDYYAFCPNCGRKQIKKNLIENGCFICSWKGTEEDIELAKAMSLQTNNLGYKTNCPNCGASVITEEFLKDGCWRCGCKD
jgi:isocitrate dehydrogenase kinase/phosphatase